MTPRIASMILGINGNNTRDTAPTRRRPHCTAKDPIDPKTLRKG